MNKRRKPEISEKYWFVDSLYEVHYDTWGGFNIDRKLFDSGNCFETEEEAKSAAKQVKELMLSLHEQNTGCAQLPKLTTEVFDRPDCPEGVLWATVDEDGTAYFHFCAPMLYADEWQRTNSCKKIPGKWDATKWTEIIQRPLPGWCKVGEWVYYEPRSAYCNIEQMCDGFMLRFLNGDSTAIPRFDVKTLKQARFRPYNEVEMRALVGKVVTNAEGNDYLCTAFNRATDNSVAVVDIDTWVSSKYMLEHGYTIDGEQCGVLEHLENGEWVK